MLGDRQRRGITVIFGQRFRWETLGGWWVSAIGKTVVFALSEMRNHRRAFAEGCLGVSHISTGPWGCCVGTRPQGGGSRETSGDAVSVTGVGAPARVTAVAMLEVAGCGSLKVGWWDYLMNWTSAALQTFSLSP